MKTLIFRLSSIGDIVLTGPFVRRLQATLPEQEIVYVTRTEFAPLVRCIPHVSRVFEVDTRNGRAALHALRDELRAMDFTHVFDMHNNFRTQFLRKGLSGTLQVYRKSHLKWMALVGLKWNLYAEIVPVAERYMRAARVGGLTPDAEPAHMHIPNEAADRARALLTGSGLVGNGPLIALCPGAKHFTKRYPQHRALAVASLLLFETNARIAVIGGEDDAEIGHTIAAVAPSRIVNLCGMLSLTESAAALAQCEAAISNDSGLMHLATAVGTPVVALFGSTVREFGFFPYNAPAAVLEVDGLYCRPCTHIGRAKCPKGHFKCMEEIHPSSVVAALRELADL